jgi:hypothetical protein
MLKGGHMSKKVTELLKSGERATLALAFSVQSALAASLNTS